MHATHTFVNAWKSYKLHAALLASQGSPWSKMRHPPAFKRWAVGEDSTKEARMEEVHRDWECAVG